MSECAIVIPRCRVALVCEQACCRDARRRLCLWRAIAERDGLIEDVVVAIARLIVFVDTINLGANKRELNALTKERGRLSTLQSFYSQQIAGAEQFNKTLRNVHQRFQPLNEEACLEPIGLDWIGEARDATRVENSKLKLRQRLVERAISSEFFAGHRGHPFCASVYSRAFLQQLPEAILVRTHVVGLHELPKPLYPSGHVFGDKTTAIGIAFQLPYALSTLMDALDSPPMTIESYESVVRYYIPFRDGVIRYTAIRHDSFLREIAFNGSPNAPCEYLSETGLRSQLLGRGVLRASQFCAGCDLLAKTAFRVCARCRHVYYCDKTCQTRHWPVHKNECRK